MDNKEFKQTWWDDNLKDRMFEFEYWIGDSNQPSKKVVREYVISSGYKSLLDIGCGTATEFFAYKQEYPELSYIGIDSSEFLYKRNKELGVTMLLSPGESVPLPDNHSDVAFARHVLEHQPSFKPLLSEMIRLARREAIHVFFIPPGEREITCYDQNQNLYHNTFSRFEIEEFLDSREDVDFFVWIPVPGTNEIVLSIIKKQESHGEI